MFSTFTLICKNLLAHRFFFISPIALPLIVVWIRERQKMQHPRWLTLSSLFLDQIEAIMNDFIQLKPQSNVDEAETMVEGRGLSFHRDDSLHMWHFHIFSTLNFNSYVIYFVHVGTLDGFSFDSEEEGDKLPKAAAHQTDRNEDIEEQPKGKTKGKANKTSVCF